MKLRYCLYLTSTPDFTDIANLEELILEGCKNLVKVHSSIGILKKLIVLNMRDCTCLKSFPSNLEMDSLQVLILSGCLKLDKLPEDLGRIKSLTELHADRTAITEVPSFVSSLINLESLSIGGQGRIQPRWWTSITAPFGLLSKQQHPQRSVSLTGSFIKRMDVIYDGNNIPEWFTNKSTGNHAKVELASDWCVDKFRGFGTCVVFRRKKAFRTFEGYSVKNFDGSSLDSNYFPYYHGIYFS
ncbi:NB-ARC domains-containing protein, partial [Tanacetum coccineum]